MLFSDFVGMPTCVRKMEIKKVLKVAVVKMINDFMSIYQVSCQMLEFQQIHSQESILEYGRCPMKGIRLVAYLYTVSRRLRFSSR